MIFFEYSLWGKFNYDSIYLGNIGVGEITIWDCEDDPGAGVLPKQKDRSIF